MQAVFFAMLYAALIFDNFRLTEMLYVFMVEEGFNRSADYLDMLIDLARTTARAN